MKSFRGNAKVADEALIYISAASDLEYERDLLGRTITEIPVTLGWRIEQTPARGKPPDLEAVANADVHLILLASDIRAPIGIELLVARRSGNRPIFLKKSNTIHTPAAQEFSREIEKTEAWRTFRHIADLRHQVLKLLGDHLLKNASYYALRPSEFDNLKTWRKQLEERAPEIIEETRGGAGESGVILSPERYVPSNGILIEKPDDKSNSDPAD